MTRLVTFGSTFDLDSNGNLTALTAALAPYFTLTPVAPVVVVPPPPPPVPNYVAPILLTVMCQNGKTPLLPQDYSYDAKDARGDIIDGGRGNPACVKVTLTGPWGGFQPSCLNGQSLNFRVCSHIVTSISAPKGTQFSMGFLRAGDIAIQTTAPVLFTKTVDGWEDFSFLKAALMTDVALGDMSATIYKGAIQAKVAAVPVGGFSFLVDNWGGV